MGDSLETAQRFISITQTYFCGMSLSIIPFRVQLTLSLSHVYDLLLFLILSHFRRVFVQTQLYCGTGSLVFLESGVLWVFGNQIHFMLWLIKLISDLAHSLDSCEDRLYLLSVRSRLACLKTASIIPRPPLATGSLALYRTSSIVSSLTTIWRLASQFFGSELPSHSHTTAL